MLPQGISLDFLSHEPCILKHGSSYDDPWRYNYHTPHDRKGTKKPLLVYDRQTFQITDYRTREEFCEKEHVAISTISNATSSGRLCFDRFIFGANIDQLFRNMHRHGFY